jgi:ubiquinone/menaquinone biosynthesis C-methylase UbiE
LFISHFSKITYDSKSFLLRKKLLKKMLAFPNFAGRSLSSRILISIPDSGDLGYAGRFTRVAELLGFSARCSAPRGDRAKLDMETEAARRALKSGIQPKPNHGPSLIIGGIEIVRIALTRYLLLGGTHSESEQMTSIDRSRKHEFTGMGELYDRARPAYPPALFKQLDDHFNFRIGETALEIGCGTGKATEHLAARGLTITGIDIAPDLLAIANGKLKGWKVRLLQSSFEDFTAPDALFNYIVAAAAFHWIDPAIAFKKTRFLLKENGAVILIWTIRRDPDSPERAAIDGMYGKYAPSLLARPWQETGPAAGISQTAYNEARAMLEKDIAEGRFRNLKTFTVHRQQIYTTEDYLSLLDTYSDHKRLKPDERTCLYAALKTFINERGGRIEIPYDCVALTACAA